jgi:predicted esterase
METRVALADRRRAVLGRARGDGPLSGAVLVLHGGKVRSTEPVRPTNLAYLRMRPFAAAVARRAERDGVGGPGGIGALLLRDRFRGWNGADADPVTDALWALERIEQRYGRIPVVLLGHSMGARAALRAAGHPTVTGVVALAPWLPEDEPVAQLDGRRVLIAHGELDTVTDPAKSRAYAERARAAGTDVEYRVIPGGKHAMLADASAWHAPAAEFAVGHLAAQLADAPI